MQESPCLRTCYSNGRTWTTKEDKKQKLWKQKEETKLKRKTLKRRNIKQQQVFVYSEGQQYKSGASHENSPK